MSYKDRIRELTINIPDTLVDFSLPRDKSRTPSQASSNFITNKEQGDWAENLIFRAINETSKNFIAVKYGKSDDLIAGDEGFDTFYQNFQTELDTIGKRPDLLIFKKSDFQANLGLDISNLPHDLITTYVEKAIAGIEVRSSAFLIDKYEEYMSMRTKRFTEEALAIRDEILLDYNDVFENPVRQKYRSVLQGITRETLSITDFKIPGWRSSEQLAHINDLLKKLKSAIKEVQKRDFLSITPKVEDIKVVYKWVETFNVPYFYFQVFFDKIYGISFERILEVVSDPNKEDIVFSVEEDTKNQNKTTIKINSKYGIPIAYKIDEPEHRSVRKEIGRGRLLFYVTFNGGSANLNVGNLINILGIKEKEF